MSAGKGSCPIPGSHESTVVVRRAGEIQRRTFEDSLKGVLRLGSGPFSRVTARALLDWKMRLCRSCLSRLGKKGD